VSDNRSAYAEDGTGTATLEVLEGATVYNRWIVDLMRPRLGERNIELGAGHGTLTQIVAETHRVMPFELSEHNQRVLNRRFAGHARVAPCRSDLFEYEEWGSVDAVYSANVLEHIEDDLAVVRHCARLLKPGGWFVAFVPAGTWLYSRFDRKLGHCRRYSGEDRERLRRVVNGSGCLELREFRYVNVIGALGWFVKMRLFRQVSVNSRDTALVERLLPVNKLVDALRPPFGQSALIALERVEA
jgi:SAM-dependent methyltransferase